MSTAPKAPKTTRQQITLGLIGTLLALTAWVAWDNWGRQAPASNNAPVTLANPQTDAAQRIERGQYLARAGNCVACHTTRGGEPMAGGRRIDTPFGSVFSTNLTPDPTTGLGQWTADDFWQALHLGRSKGGRLLIPAFPYNHTSVITRSDSDDLLAWLQSLPPVQQSAPPHTLVWPVGTQAVLAVWRSLFFSSTPFQPDPSQSAQWNRGAYLVQGLGHCAACHSPRNELGASGPVTDLSGGLMPVVNWYAPDLTSERETGLASTPVAEIVRLLQSGASASAQTSGPMAEVVQHGTRHMNEADLQAMAVYLQGRAQNRLDNSTATGTVHPAKVVVTARVAEQGLKVYERHCVQCHGEQGRGATTASGDVAYPALAGNRAVLLRDPTNLVQTVLYGGYGPVTAGQPRPFGMPPFVLELDDRDIAAVLTHLRTQWGNTAAEVTPLQVNRIRAASTP
ncbi:MAG: cytochrome c [Limnohabitans sp.]|nr:cytochrome c [Limnohabitans sp.]